MWRQLTPSYSVTTTTLPALQERLDSALRDAHGGFVGPGGADGTLSGYSMFL